MYRRLSLGGILVLFFWLGLPRPASALEDICDPAYRNCRATLISLIRNETVAIDVAFWFMEDQRYTTELIARHNAGVKIRVLVDPRANSSYPANADRLAELAAAGIPMRKRIASGILHWKMMLFAGQGVVEFSAANYSGEAFKYISPYTNYIDEAVIFTSNSWVVPPFKSRFDDLWTNTSSYADYANISGPLTRAYPTYSDTGVMNFVPKEDFGARAINEYNAETSEIDAIIYRITDRRHTDALIAARGRGVTVRLIVEPNEYRNPKRLWDAWNVDRLYMAGVRIRKRAHAGLLHQKSTILRSRGRIITGSSNWTTPSARTQEEHNYFTGRSSVFNWFVHQFERKWHNSTGYAETTAFTPLPPDKPVYVSPASGTRVGTSVTLKWKTGPWAHKADIYFGTSSTPPRIRQAYSVSPNSTASITISNLAADRTYYWKIVSKTMANKTASGPVWTIGT